MANRETLTVEDLDLLVEMLCCVIAADKKVSGREVDVVITALTALGQTTQKEPLKRRVVDYCKAIHKRGVDSYVADVVQRAKRLAGLPLATSFIEAQPTLLYADGSSTPDEERVSQQIVQCLTGVLAAAENEPMPDVELDEPTASLGTSMLGTAKSSMALAGATAERTKITTVTLPAAFIALGKHCVASKAFAAEFSGIYAAIAKLSEETKATAAKLAASSTASTFAGKAQEFASRGMTLAISQKQSVQYQKLMHDLGKAVYESKGAGSGPKDLCARISKSKQRLDELASTVTTHSKELKGSAAGVGRSAVEAATSSAKTTWSPLAWSKKKIAAAAVAGFLGLSIVGSWMDKPENGQPLQTESDSGSPAGEPKLKGSETRSPSHSSEEYESAVKQGLISGEQDRAMIDRVISSTGSADIAMDSVRQRKSKFLTDLLEARRAVAQGGNPVILEITQGRYDGYQRGLGPHAKR